MISKLYYNKNRIYYNISVGLKGFAIGVVAFWSAQLAIWAYWPYPTAEVTTPIMVINKDKTVERGEKLELLVELDKRSDITPTVSRNIYCADGSVALVGSSANGGNARPKGKFVAFPSFEVPEKVPANVACYFQFTNEYKVSPLKTVSKVWASEAFMVKE